MSIPTLRELVQSSQSIVEALIESGGELTPEMDAQLQNLEVNLPAKIDGYASIMDRMEMEEAYWKAKAETLRSVAKGCANVRERLKESLKYAAQQMSASELVGNDVKFKISNSKPRLIVDETLLDDAYKMHVTTIEVDKKKIEEDLKIGVPVVGAHLSPTHSIRAYVNKAAK